MISKEKKFKSVLLVDDDETSNFITRKMLDFLLIAERTKIVFNGLQALEYLEKSCSEEGNSAFPCPDLILLDVNMPEMNGFQFLDEFFGAKKPFPNKIKIIILTSSEFGEDVERSKNYPIQGYISKPLTSLNLKQVLEKV